jgi:hypothetical protein
MSRASLFFVLCCAAVAAPLSAQQAKPVTTPPPTAPVAAAQAAPTPKPAAPPAAPLPALPVNIKVELAIEETASGVVSNKNVLLITSNGDRGSIRSTMRTPAEGEVILNVDARPRITADGRIGLELVFMYTPQRPSRSESAPSTSDPMPGFPSNLTEQLNVFLTDGKKTTIAESADPRGDRKVTVGVTATILK